MAVQRQAVYLLEFKVDSVGEKVHEPRHKKKRQAKCEGAKMVKVIFAIIGYVFAGAAIAGWYDSKENPWIFGWCIGIVWPLYIAWLPVKFVYNQVKEQAYKQLKKKIEENKPAVPPGRFRLDCCENCKKWLGIKGDEFAICESKLKLVSKGDYCRKYCDKYEGKR